MAIMWSNQWQQHKYALSSIRQLYTVEIEYKIRQQAFSLFLGPNKKPKNAFFQFPFYFFLLLSLQLINQQHGYRVSNTCIGSTFIVIQHH